MFGDSIEESIKGNRLFGDKKVSLLGKPTGPKPQCLLKELPLKVFYISNFNGIQVKPIHMHFRFSFKDSLKWSSFIALVTLLLSAGFTIVSTVILAGVGWGLGMLLVIMFVLIGIFFDILGLAAASADEKPYHSLASEKVDGSKQAIYIVRNADKFSNFCNDVIGDISGIVSGTASAGVVLHLIYAFNQTEESFTFKIISVLFTAIVAALTVGGKAVGKTFAIHNAILIILKVGRFFSFLERHFHITIFNGNKKPKRKVRKKNESVQSNKP